jgi:DNA recombination protein RmuC
MEAIVRDGLPVGAYDFQFTLSNRARPDCVVRLPGDPRPLAVDAKFPLKGFSALRAARNDEARKSAQARGAPMSASTSRTSPTAISYPARRRTWR